MNKSKVENGEVKTVEKKMCIKCGKYPAEEAQTICEFCMFVEEVCNKYLYAEEYLPKAAKEFLTKLEK